MAIVLEPPSPTPGLVGGETEKPVDTGLMARPHESTQGWMSWLTTTDHKRIGIMYGFSALIFLLGCVQLLRMSPRTLCLLISPLAVCFAASLARKYPSADWERGWQWVFRSATD